MQTQNPPKNCVKQKKAAEVSLGIRYQMRMNHIE